MQLQDGRMLAWAEAGDLDGRPLLRLPGTPGSRMSLRADQTPWLERRVRVINTERPGYGSSTPHPEGTFAGHADDLVALLDHLELERVPVVGGSGGAPYVLALASRHPDRVQAATVVVGAAPVEASEVELMISVNAEAHRLATAGDRDGLIALLAPIREAMLADPLASIRSQMETAPPEDHAIMAEPLWREGFARGVREAFRPGLDGWLDESMLLVNGWPELRPEDVRTSLTWWHGDSDRNSPLSAVRRLVTRIPKARLEVWPEAGHLTPHREEPRILDELLARA